MSIPLVMLPDMMCDARVFSHQFADLSRDRLLIAAPVSAHESMGTMAAALSKKLPRRFALWGVGFGGQVAMEMLRMMPERIDRVCLMSTSPLAMSPEQAAAQEPMIVRAQAGGFGEVLREMLPPEDLAESPARPDVMAQWQMMAEAIGPAAFVRQLRALQRRADRHAMLRRCKVPALIACGDADRAVPVRRHSVIAGLMPDARLQVIECAGRLPPLEAPDAVTEMLREWLGAPLVLKGAEMPGAARAKPFRTRRRKPAMVLQAQPCALRPEPLILR